MLHQGTPRDCLTVGELPGQVPNGLGSSNRYLDARLFNAGVNVTAAGTPWTNTSTGSCNQDTDLSVTTPHNLADPFSKSYLSPASLSHQVYSTWSTAVFPPLPLPQDIAGERLHSFPNLPTAYYHRGCDWALRSIYPRATTAFSSAIVAPEMGGAYARTDTHRPSNSMATNTYSNSTFHTSDSISPTQSTPTKRATAASDLVEGLKLPQRRGAMQLWEFLLEQLDKPCNSHIIKWVKRESLTFQVVDPDMLATGWGEVKGRPKMNYDNLCRSLRYYYQKKFLTKVHSEQYVYQFLCPPSILRQALAGRSKDQRKNTVRATLPAPGVVSSCTTQTPAESQTIDQGHEEASRQTTGLCNEEPLNQWSLCHQQVRIKPEPMDYYDSSTSAPRNYPPQQWEGYWQTLPTHHADVVYTKQEQDPELNDTDHIPSCSTKFPERQGVIQMWEFLLDMLNTTENRSIVCWQDAAAGKFQIIEPDELARRWGAISGHTDMSYDEMSYAFDHYCHTRLLVNTGKNSFQFLCSPAMLYEALGHRANDLAMQFPSQQFDYSQFSSDCMSSTSSTPSTEEDRKEFMNPSEQGTDKEMQQSLPYYPANQKDIKPERNSGVSSSFMQHVPGFPLSAQISASDLLDMELFVAEANNYECGFKVEQDWDPDETAKRSIGIGQRLGEVQLIEH